MAPKRSLGPVETAYKVWTDGFADALDARQRAAVAHLLSLARRMDSAPDETLSAAGTLSREIRACADELRDAGHVGSAPDAEEAATPPAPADGVADIQKAREERLKRLGGPA